MGNTKKSRARRYAARVWVAAGTLPPLPAGTYADKAKHQFISDKGYWFAPNPRTHGEWTTYNNWYCRCPPCIAYNTARQRRRRSEEENSSAAR